MSTLNLERMLRLHWMWPAGAPAAISADRGRAAQPGPGTTRMLDSGHSSVSPWRGMDTLHMTPMWCPEAVIVKQVHSNYARLDIRSTWMCILKSRITFLVNLWSLIYMWQFKNYAITDPQSMWQKIHLVNIAFRKFCNNSITTKQCMQRCSWGQDRLWVCRDWRGSLLAEGMLLWQQHSWCNLVFL